MNALVYVKKNITLSSMKYYKKNNMNFCIQNLYD